MISIIVNWRLLLVGHSCFSNTFLCHLRSIAAHRDHFVRRLPMGLSGSRTFLVVTHSYVWQATHAFLGMLPLCCYVFIHEHLLFDLSVTLLVAKTLTLDIIFVSPAKHSNTWGSLCPACVCLSVCLSDSQTFLVVFLGPLSGELLSYPRCRHAYNS